MAFKDFFKIGRKNGEEKIETEKTDAGNQEKEEIKETKTRNNLILRKEGPGNIVLFLSLFKRIYKFGLSN